MTAKGLIGSAVFIAVMVAITLWTGARLPDGANIPVHFGLDGQPERFGDRSEAMFGLWFMVGTSVFVTLVLAFAPALSPRATNIDTSSRAYLLIWLAVMAMMAVVTGCISASMLGHDDVSTRALVGSLAAAFAVIGNYMPKTRSNWVVGVRTPWTLSSETSWNATHRVVGRMFLIGGIIGVALAVFAPTAILIAAILVLVLLPALVGIVYSYLVWRTADDKIGEPDLVD